LDIDSVCVDAASEREGGSRTGGSSTWGTGPAPSLPALCHERVGVIRRRFVRSTSTWSVHVPRPRVACSCTAAASPPAAPSHRTSVSSNMRHPSSPSVRRLFYVTDRPISPLLHAGSERLSSLSSLLSSLFSRHSHRLSGPARRVEWCVSSNLRSVKSTTHLLGGLFGSFFLHFHGVGQSPLEILFNPTHNVSVGSSTCQYGKRKSPARLSDPPRMSRLSQTQHTSTPPSSSPTLRTKPAPTPYIIPRDSTRGNLASVSRPLLQPLCRSGACWPTGMGARPRPRPRPRPRAHCSWPSLCLPYALRSCHARVVWGR
jgi:hypothetical protein